MAAGPIPEYTSDIWGDGDSSSIPAASPASAALVDQQDCVEGASSEGRWVDEPMSPSAYRESHSPSTPQSPPYQVCYCLGLCAHFYVGHGFPRVHRLLCLAAACCVQAFHHDPAVKHFENPAFKRVARRSTHDHTTKLLLRLSAANVMRSGRRAPSDRWSRQQRQQQQPLPRSFEELTPFQQQALMMHEMSRRW